MIRRLIALSLLLSGVFAAFTFAITASQWRSLPASVGRPVFELGQAYSPQARSDDELLIEALGANSAFTGQQVDTLLNPLLTFGVRALDAVACAPDGQALLFFAPYLYRLDVRRKALAQLTFFPRQAFALASSPDQQRIAFMEATATLPMILTSADADGSNLSALYFPIDEFLDASLSWSPDSRAIAFVQTVPAGDQVPSFRISIIDAATHTVRLVYQSTQEISQVSWSPDGQRLAFQMRDPVYDNIYSIQTDGTGLTRLTNDPQQDYDPRWSPDGALISYGFVSPRDPFQLYVMNADGSDPHPVFVAPGDHELRNLCWLKD